MDFCSAKGERLGDKSSLAQETHEVIGIPVQAQETLSSQFSIYERMSRNKEQETLREEDAASSMLGIFDLHMLLLYGEGRAYALRRFLKEIVELLIHRVRPGYKRLRWRCSCNTVLWGDIPIDDDDVLDQLKRELSWRSIPSTQQASSIGTFPSQLNIDSGPSRPETIQLAPMQPTGSSEGLMNEPSAALSSQSAMTNGPHIVNVISPPRYFEVCINTGNYAIDHHEIDISNVYSDGELFGLIWDKYNCSRGFGLRRLFLKPRDVHFVMFSVSRRIQYGAGIHKKPDEFPPQQELDSNRYHYLCPKIRMPANVFLHYLHRARWNVWGEHTDDTWLQRLPKKLNESVLAEWRQDDATAQQAQGEAIADSNLAFGWGVHIVDGPNHAVLGILITIGVTVAFIVSGMVVGFAKTEEQGFAVGQFLLAILASIMASVYFLLHDS